ncbi:MAG: MarC family protein [Bifidobacteriaceae bacterium]|jgi:multiple antibiotic resistance protein|nr:MarC family protein [Bifidobacteriaceae bacterium]
MNADLMSIAGVGIAAFLALLPIVNPIGAMASFAGLTSQLDAKYVRRQAFKTALNVFIILASFTILGSIILEVFGISLPSIQIAGGFVVAHSAMGMLNPKEQLTGPEKEHALTKPDISFTPMALPLIAGPGAIGEVIALAARYPDILDRTAVLLATVAIAAMIFVLLRWGTPVIDKLGPTGIGALTRVMGFIILCIGVGLMIHGIQTLNLFRK